MPQEVVSIRLPTDMKSRLERLAEATGRSAAFYVRATLDERMDDLEWAYGIAARTESLSTGRRAARLIDSLIADLGFTREELSSGDGRQGS